LKKNFFLLQFVAKERIKDEICKAFKHGNPFGFISLLDELNVLKFLFPALYAIKGVNQPVRYHPFDVYAHTLLTLKSLQEINTDYLTRFGMLYHDVGKADQYYMHELPLDRDEVRKIFGSWLNHHTSGMDHVKKDF
jgi:tRNA nucleotidyltransferase/poly(A) polymerase